MQPLCCQTFIGAWVKIRFGIRFWWHGLSAVLFRPQVSLLFWLSADLCYVACWHVENPLLFSVCVNTRRWWIPFLNVFLNIPPLRHHPPRCTVQVEHTQTCTECSVFCVCLVAPVNSDSAWTETCMSTELSVWALARPALCLSFHPRLGSWGLTPALCALAGLDYVQG